MLLTIHNINMFSYTFSSSLQFTLLTFLHISSGICDLSQVLLWRYLNEIYSHSKKRKRKKKCSMVEARIPDLMKENCGSNYSANGVMNVLFQVCHSFFGRLVTNYCHYISLSLSLSLVKVSSCRMLGHLPRV